MSMNRVLQRLSAKKVTLHFEATSSFIQWSDRLFYDKNIDSIITNALFRLGCKQYDKKCIHDFP